MSLLTPSTQPSDAAAHSVGADLSCPAPMYRPLGCGKLFQHSQAVSIPKSQPDRRGFFVMQKNEKHCVPCPEVTTGQVSFFINGEKRKTSCLNVPESQPSGQRKVSIKISCPRYPMSQGKLTEKVKQIKMSPMSRSYNQISAIS